MTNEQAQERCTATDAGAASNWHWHERDGDSFRVAPHNARLSADAAQERETWRDWKKLLDTSTETNRQLEADLKQAREERDDYRGAADCEADYADDMRTRAKAAEVENARLRAAIYLEVEYLDGPKGAHAYDKHGFHRNDCAACRIRERLRAALEQAP